MPAQLDRAPARAVPAVAARNYNVDLPHALVLPCRVAAPLLSLASRVAAAAERQASPPMSPVVTKPPAITVGIDGLPLDRTQWAVAAPAADAYAVTPTHHLHGNDDDCNELPIAPAPASPAPIDLRARALATLTRSRLPDCEPKYFCLHPGAVFTGTQHSQKSAYAVRVTVQSVDLAHNTLCGFLTIDGLTYAVPQLVTYFEAEVVADREAFWTRKWGSDPENDYAHWREFEGFAEEADEILMSEDDAPYTFRNQTRVFMRWKELFMVPDHRVDQVEGASFDGFYFICVDVVNARIGGFYYHPNSEKFQRLDLNYVPTQSSAEFAFH
ncbi:GID complex subunit 4, VID24 [Allomyces arbusculus]|nr:GID complex subunit 4, VID24 [Allomyces arbusculus]